MGILPPVSDDSEGEMLYGCLRWEGEWSLFGQQG